MNGDKRNKRGKYEKNNVIVFLMDQQRFDTTGVHGNKTLAHYFNEAGYETGYIGKWHLGSGEGPDVCAN